MELFTVEDMPPYIQAFLHEKRNSGRKENSVQRYVYDLNDFLQWMEDAKHATDFETWSELDMDDYVDYFQMLRREKNYSKRTLHRFRTVLNQLAVHYAREGMDVVLPKFLVLESLMKDRALTRNDFIDHAEFERLTYSVLSPVGLTERQLIARPFLMNRNLAILVLFTKYGLSMHELSELSWDDVNLVAGEIKVTREAYERIVEIDRNDILLLNYYMNDVPKAVRPRRNRKDPFFVAFDFYRGTYHWDYPTDAPKRIAEVSIQKMIRGEIRKAEFKRRVTARHLRNTSILNSLLNKEDRSIIFQTYGFKTEWYIKRFMTYAFTINPDLRDFYLADERERERRTVRGGAG